MSAVYEWVRNITYYMIFITVAGNLLANSKYEKYLRFFAGMVLILLVLKPLTGGLRLDERIAYLFESITFQKEADDFKEKLWGMEDERLEQVMSAYEDAVALDLRGMAEDSGFSVKDVRAAIESDRDDPMYGHVTDIYMKLAAGRPEMGTGNGGGTAVQEEEAGDDAGEESSAGPDVSPVGIPAQQIRVEPVQLGKEERQARERAATFPADPKVRSKINGLIRKVAGYYGLETAHVQVEWEDD